MQVKFLISAWFLSGIFAGVFADFGGDFGVVHADTAENSQISLQSQEKSGAKERLRLLLGGDNGEKPQFLPVDEAFRLEISPVAGAPGQLRGEFLVADGYYLYRDKIRFRSRDAELPAALPPGERKNDPYFGEMAVFKRSFSAPILLRENWRETDEVRVRAEYQGCAEGGICYAPVSKEFSLAPRLIARAWAGPANSAANSPANSPAIFSGAARDAAEIAAQSLPSPLAALLAQSRGLLPAAFLAGLLLSFTPCVLPMLPILSGVIAAQNAPGARVTRRRGALLALAYVLGATTAYAAAGAVAGASGEQLQAYFQNAWVIAPLAAVLLLMALSMFGAFRIEMPAAIRSAVHARTTGLRGALPAVFALGAISSVVVGACVSPALIAFLGVAVASADAALGAQLMAAMALGMGAPLIAFGAGAGHLLPRAGKWSVAVNRAFGVMLVAVAIYLLGSLPAVPVLWLWAAFLLALGAYLLAARLSIGAVHWRRGARAVGAGLLAWGALALAGGAAGERDVLRPLPANWLAGAAGHEYARAPAKFTRVGNPAELEREFARAAAAGKFVLLDYYADWCADCARMKKTTFRDARVAALLDADFVALQVDVTDPRDAGGKALKKRFGVFGPPAVLLFGKDGAELPGKHFYGYRGPKDFHALISSL